MCRTNRDLTVSHQMILIMSLIGNTMNKRNRRQNNKKKKQNTSSNFSAWLSVAMWWVYFFSFNFLRYSKWFCRFFSLFFSFIWSDIHRLIVQKKSYDDDDDDVELIFALFDIWFGMVLSPMISRLRSTSHKEYQIKPNKFFLLATLSTSHVNRMQNRNQKNSMDFSKTSKLLKFTFVMTILDDFCVTWKHLCALTMGIWLHNCRSQVKRWFKVIDYTECCGRICLQQLIFHVQCWLRSLMRIHRIAIFSFVFD